jgi:hypothetical protein
MRREECIIFCEFFKYNNPQNIVKKNLKMIPNWQPYLKIKLRRLDNIG